MSDGNDASSRSPKRRKTTRDDALQGNSSLSLDSGKPSLFSLSRSITPPPSRQPLRDKGQSVPGPKHPDASRNGLTTIPSPVQLTRIRDIPDDSGNNVDTVQLCDLLGDPLIKECWQFNYLFDVDFLMSQFDPDVRSLVQVKVVHGSWKREAPNRIRIDEACSRYSNVEPIVAYMPEPFGTHHSKMMILVRHDDLAQVIIHTANMIPGDWANMCQVVWRSPLLPLSSGNTNRDGMSEMAVGGGHRFKRDLLAYLGAYGQKKTGPLVEQLRKYDFSDVRAALIASVPTRQELGDLGSRRKPIWGWPAVKDALRHVPLRRETSSQESRPQIVVQISSVATIGQTDKWLKDTFFDSLSSTSRTFKDKHTPSPRFSIMFPTPDEIRRSLNGYGSGGSIHMKIQSAAQQKQLQYLRPYLCHWTGYADNPAEIASESRHDDNDGHSSGKTSIREAGRRRAAPHIKTYIRFSDADMTTIDWAMVTSANLSNQAWGAAPNAKNEVRICSWEIGVLVWSDLLVDSHGSTEDGGEEATGGKANKTSDVRGGFAEMVPCFKQDVPSLSASLGKASEPGASSGISPSSCTRVGFRMAYDLPLRPYTKQEMPWCATSVYTEPDWLGQTWESA